MRLSLPNGMDIRGDLISFLVKRTDLTPIPSTVEFLIRLNDEIEPFFKEGETVNVAEIPYRIIFMMKNADVAVNKGNPNFTLTKVIAVLEGCYKLSFLTEKAIIKENTSLGTLYRACGATMAIEKDIQADHFNCLVGDYPSYSLMRAMGRTASVIVWNGKSAVSFIRVSDLFKQKAVEVMPVDITQNLQSSFLERHETPAYFTNTADGGIAKTGKSGRRADFEMFADKLILNNLNTHLVNRKIWTTTLMPTLNAGDVVEIEKKNYVVITAVHAIAKSEAGSNSQMSRFWLGDLSTNK